MSIKNVHKQRPTIFYDFRSPYLPSLTILAYNIKLDIIDGHSLFKTNDEIDTVVIKQERHKISTWTLFAFCS